MRLNLTQLYGSTTAGSVVCWGVCKVATIRFLICRDLLVLQQLLLRLGDPVSTALGAIALCALNSGIWAPAGASLPALSLPAEHWLNRPQARASPVGFCHPKQSSRPNSLFPC